VSNTTAAASAGGKAGERQPQERNGMYSAPPPMSIDTSKFYYATFKTAKGDIKVQLFADRTPQTVNNFIFLAREGFYDNTTFHRVLDSFMAQGGDPTGTGAGGPGYQFEDEFDPSLSFDRSGLLAMANSGPGTNGSQFFITFAPADWLNQRHTIFGEIVEGTEILNALTRRDPEQSPTTPGDTLTTVTIEESDTSILPPPPPTPTPFAPSALDANGRPLAAVELEKRTGYFNTAPDSVIDAGQAYTAAFATSQGVITVTLRSDLAPKAVNNFVLLADLGFYDNTPVNAVQPGQFVIIGSPGNRPDSDAGYKLLPESNLPVDLGPGLLAYLPLQSTAEGVLTSGSQLFFTLSTPSPEDTLNFSFFGAVIGGQEVLPKLTLSDTIQSAVVVR
jgi:cyclophilin family peptidyl-prolyl cis-trans isomerase